MTEYQLHTYDLPADLSLSGSIAIDTETMGLIPSRDRLCLVQLRDEAGSVHLVHFPKPEYAAPNLKALLSDGNRVKLFHYARFDVAIIRRYLGLWVGPVYCTKIASKLVRTYTDRHGLKDICRELLNVELSKQQQSSDWGAEHLTPEQCAYAASDVLHLHALKEKLDVLLEREGRTTLAQQCFRFLPARAALDLMGMHDHDIFAH